MQFTLGKNILVQLAALIAVLGGALASLDPAVMAWLQANAGSSKVVMLVFLLAYAAQGYAALKAHGVNHDGTPQTKAFDPFVKEPEILGPFPFDQPQNQSVRPNYKWDDADFDHKSEGE